MLFILDKRLLQGHRNLEAFMVDIIEKLNGINEKLQKNKSANSACKLYNINVTNRKHKRLHLKKHCKCVVLDFLKAK